MTDEMYKELKERLTEEGLICKRNDFAIKIIDNVFDQYSKLWDK